MIDIEKLSFYSPETMTAFAEYYSDMYSFYEMTLPLDKTQVNTEFLNDYSTLHIMAALSANR